jgi:hypothetical protein
MNTAYDGPIGIREDPPARRGGAAGKGSIQAFVALCRADPWNWYKYPITHATGAAAHTYRKSFPGTEWMSSRAPDSSRVYLYCRDVSVPDPRPAVTPEPAVKADFVPVFMELPDDY